MSSNNSKKKKRNNEHEVLPLTLEDIDVEPLDGEVWKLYDGEYTELIGLLAVSNKGRIFKRGTGTYKNKTRLVTGTKNNQGYIRLHVSVKGKAYNRAVHRLLAEMFCDNPLNLPYVDHIDAVRDNNDSSNLRWVTHQENCRNPHYSKKLGNRVSEQLAEHNYLQERNKKKCYAVDDKGNKIEFNSLQELSQHFGINSGIGADKRNTGKPIKRGALKGWKVYTDE